MRKLYVVTLLFILGTCGAYAQNGELQGHVLDATTGKPITYTQVVLLLHGSVVNGAITDDGGNYAIKPIPPGTYEVKCQYTGYNILDEKDILITGDKTQFQDLKLTPSVNQITEVVISAKKLIDPDNVTQQTTYSFTDIQQLASSRNSPNDIVSASAGVFQRDAGGSLNIMGNRDYNNKYYVDGVPMFGAMYLPSSSIEQESIITGGVPARYGDATGGIINITTRGPSSEFAGSANLETSEFLDAQGEKLVDITFSGPIYTKYKSSRGKPHDSSDTKIGFIINAEYSGSTDGAPSAIGMYRVKDSVLNAIRANPLEPLETTTGVTRFVETEDYITSKDLVKLNAKQNVAGNSFALTAKLDFKLSKYTDVIVGTNSNFGEGYDYNYMAQLFDANNNQYNNGGTFTGYVRFTQRFAPPSNTEKSATFQNAYYTIQADFTKSAGSTWDKSLGKSNILNYGYYGKFNALTEPNYAFVDSIYNPNGNGKKIALRAKAFTGTTDTLITYQPAGINPELEAYVKDYYTLTGSTPINGVYGINGEHSYYANFSDLLFYGGEYDGYFPANIYSMYTPVGLPQAGISQYNNNTYHLIFEGSVDAVSAAVNAKGEKDRHSLEFGFEYQEENDRGWSVNPYGLYTLANQLANRNAQLDSIHPIVSQYPDGNGNYTVNYNYLPINEFFAINLRHSLGIPLNQIVNVYNLSPSQISLGMFSPDELLNNGSSLVGYNGYDWKGNLLTKQPSFFDFVNQTEVVNGQTINTRPIGSFMPIYSAAWLQDKFNFKDIIFNVGVRVDRYDANQEVPKDLYSMWPIKTVGEVRNQFNIPSDIPSGWKVYVNDPNNPTSVVGYRNGDNWYSPTGAPVTDPRVIAQSSTGGQITPYLEQPYNLNSSTLVPAGFTPYVPELNFMPRISFSFPISDEALFFAHYDVLTQRPSEVQSSPYNYYFFKQIVVNSVFANPNLQPERVTDFQVGFEQALSKKSAVSISAAYKDLSDMVQVRQILYGVPVATYTTFGNVDFGTVKSLEVTYTLRRTKNIKLDFNYMLQFADGTGSNQGSQYNLVNSGAPNLRQIVPFDYDQRHTINAIVDYRYSEGSAYDGPIIGNTQILKNTGLNTIFRIGSGTPYSAQSNPLPDEEVGVQEQNELKGNINGSRLPYTFRIDMKLDHDFVFSTKKGGNGKNAKLVFINAYIYCQNLLNTLNVVTVHRYTGSPTTDGYLSSSNGQAAIAEQISAQSFTELYNIKLLDPGYFTLPRLIKVGASLNF